MAKITSQYWQDQLGGDPMFKPNHRPFHWPISRVLTSLLILSILLLSGLTAYAATEQEKSEGYRNCGLAMVYHAMGKSQESDRALADLLAEGDQWGYQFATVYGYRNERDKAFEWLEKSAALRDAGIPITKISPFFKNLHSDPRWPVFLKKIGLA